VDFDDQDWEPALASAEDAGYRSTAWKVAAGVTAGVVIGGLLMHVADRYLIQRDTVRVVQLVAPSDRGAEQSDASESTPAPRPAAETDAARAGREQQQRQAQAEQQRMAEARERAAHEEAERKAEASRQAAAERKERAWAMYYSRPAQCDDNPTRQTMIECANQYIRAKREFEAIWSAGSKAPRKGADP
jgi:hypothetical protein